MATKYKRNNRGEFETRIWDGTYTADGSKHRKKLTSKKSSADLERQVEEFRRRVKEQGQVVYSGISLGEYALQWLKTSKSTRADRTQDMYNDVIKRNLASISGIHVSDLRHSHFQQVINLYLDHPRTCQQIQLTFKQIVKAAVKDRLLPRVAIDDILEGVSLPTYAAAPKRPLTASEKQAVMDAEMDERKAAFLFVLYYTGIRKSEALALTRFDFDWKAMTLSITKALVFTSRGAVLKNPKSKNGTRKVPIPAAMVGRVKPFVDASDGGFLWHVRNGDKMTSTGYNCMWRSILVSLNAALGYNCNQKKDKPPKPITGLTAHTLRHNWCTEMCYQIPKVTTKMIARMFGDDEKMVLEIYSHIVEEKEDTSTAINDAFVV